jgi:hypothetical protein
MLYNSINLMHSGREGEDRFGVRMITSALDKYADTV